MCLFSHYLPKGNICFLLYHYRTIFLGFECFINGMMKYTLLCLAFFMHYISVRLIYSVEGSSSSFFFISYIPLYKLTTVYISILLDGYLSSF